MSSFKEQPGTLMHPEASTSETTPRPESASGQNTVNGTSQSWKPQRESQEMWLQRSVVPMKGGVREEMHQLLFPALLPMPPLG